MWPLIAGHFDSFNSQVLTSFVAVCFSFYSTAFSASEFFSEKVPEAEFIYQHQVHASCFEIQPIDEWSMTCRAINLKLRLQLRLDSI